MQNTLSLRNGVQERLHLILKTLLRAARRRNIGRVLNKSRTAFPLTTHGLNKEYLLPVINLAACALLVALRKQRTKRTLVV